MSYNMQEFPQRLSTAGKITVFTAFFGVLVFTFVFLFNVGSDHLYHAMAQSGLATTTITVLNTPPNWGPNGAQESPGSSTSSPTNAGDVQGWVATGTDPNNQPYFLLICADSNAPRPTNSTTTLGTAPPRCGTSSVEWAVSTSTISGTQAYAATTTTVAMADANLWYAWICDDDPVDAKCNAAYKQGSSTTASPFYVNHPPTFTAIANDSPTLPGATTTWTATASDADNFGTPDTVKLYVCTTNQFSATSTGCLGSTIATSTLTLSNPAASYNVVIPTQDQSYNAYVFVTDNHNLAATTGAEGSNSTFTVANAAPYVMSSTITLNNGAPIVLTNPATQTPNIALQFVASDNNSCENAATGTPGSEITGYKLSVFRADIGSSSCDKASNYNPNYCYPSEVGSTVWNLICTASTTTCTGPTDPTEVYDCTFPLWYVADPTDGAATDTPHYNTNWSAAVTPIDDNGASSTLATSTIGQELNSFLYFALDTNAIPYGSKAPGTKTDPLSATTTIRSTGNTGVDELLQGDSMCITYSPSSKCQNSSSSTIPAKEQVYATTSVSYATATSAGNTLSSTTQKLLAVHVLKPTATSTQPTGVTYWGIAVPSAITLAGPYTGQNTFYGKRSTTTFW